MSYRDIAPSVTEVLAAVREVDPSARLGALLHDEAEILCTSHKAQAVADAVLSLILRQCAPIVADASPAERKWEDLP